jgi:hypothetical protein
VHENPAVERVAFQAARELVLKVLVEAWVLLEQHDQGAALFLIQLVIGNGCDCHVPGGVPRECGRSTKQQCCR